MERTVRDLKRLGNSTLRWTKTALYYGFIPAVVLLGLRTIRADQLMNQAPM